MSGLDKYAVREIAQDLVKSRLEDFKEEVEALIEQVLEKERRRIQTLLYEANNERTDLTPGVLIRCLADAIREGKDSL